MIKKLYVNNYNCLVNFSLDFKSIQLWLGGNGTGKSSVLEIVQKLQEVLSGDEVSRLFPNQRRTRWVNEDQKMEIGLELEIEQETYVYELVLALENRTKQMRIEKEVLKWKNQEFYSFVDGEVTLFRINRDTKDVEVGAKFHADWKRSFMSNLSDREDNYPIRKFTSHIDSWLILTPRTDQSSYSDHETPILEPDTSNFVDWYRFMLQEKPGIHRDLEDALKEAIDGFCGIKLTSYGEGRVLEVSLKTESKNLDYRLDELSDGQRMLIVLYSVLFAMKHNVSHTLFLDEPDNFITLREVRPLLGEMQELCKASEKQPEKQIVIISHHPSTINELGHGDEVWFSRKNGSHVLHSIEPRYEDRSLSPAEIFEHGWE